MSFFEELKGRNDEAGLAKKGCTKGVVSTFLKVHFWPKVKVKTHPKSPTKRVCFWPKADLKINPNLAFSEGLVSARSEHSNAHHIVLSVSCGIARV